MTAVVSRTKSDAIYIRQPPYRLPRPSNSEEDFDRFHHLDLQGLSQLERWAECKRASLALAALVAGRSDPILMGADGYPLSARAWLKERIGRTSEAEAP